MWGWRGNAAHQEIEEGRGGLDVGGGASNPVIRAHVPLLTQRPPAGAARAPPVQEHAVQVARPQRSSARHELLHDRGALRLEHKTRQVVSNAGCQEKLCGYS